MVFNNRGTFLQIYQSYYVVGFTTFSQCRRRFYNNTTHDHANGEKKIWCY